MSSAASNTHIRTASPDDAAALLAIYAPYVRETAITFEYEIPSIEEFARRITHTGKIPVPCCRKESHNSGICLCRTVSRACCI